MLIQNSLSISYVDASAFDVLFVVGGEHGRPYNHPGSILNGSHNGVTSP